jgi:hypothetical protein
LVSHGTISLRRKFGAFSFSVVGAGLAPPANATIAAHQGNGLAARIPPSVSSCEKSIDVIPSAARDLFFS